MLKSAILQVFVFILSCTSVWAQTNRLSAPLNTNRIAALNGHVHHLAQSQFDQGPVEPSFAMRALTLVLKRSAEQQASLERLLIDQQDPSSPFFHQWLDPEEFAGRFGYSSADIANITDWLASAGFSIRV